MFVSVGYATCHWCHVMASEAFSDENVANFLNRHFVCIKVDREQRPDIDRFLMSVAISTTGSGGWPLNAFLSHDLRPIAALTYAPLTARYGMPSFLDRLQRVKKSYEKKWSSLRRFSMPNYTGERTEEALVIERLVSRFDLVHGGIGTGAKFPAHAQLLFMLYYFETTKDEFLTDIGKKVLTVRKRRAQPFVDKKIITSFNCLIGVGLVHSYRYLEEKSFLGKVERIFERLKDVHYKKGRLIHSSINGSLQKEEFLEDYAAMLLFITFLHEEKQTYRDYLEDFYNKLLMFEKGENQWIEADNADLFPVPAESLDYSIPSSTSVAKLALIRADVLLSREYDPTDFSGPLKSALWCAIETHVKTNYLKD